MTDLDSTMIALRHRYHASLSAKLAEIDAAWRAVRADCSEGESLATLSRWVHRLAGSAESYGYVEIGKIAASADAVLDRDCSENACADRSTTLRSTLETLLPIMESLIDALRNAADHAPGRCSLDGRASLDSS